jgi:uncharacterized protein DUF4157
MIAAIQTQTNVTPTKPAITPTQAGMLQRKCACGGSPGLTGDCEECGARKRQALQRYPANRAEPISLTRSLPTISHAETRADVPPGFGHNFAQLQARAPYGIQTKLNASRPGDRYEEEADRVSEQVIRASASSGAEASQLPTALSRIQPSIQRQSDETAAGPEPHQTPTPGPAGPAATEEAVSASLIVEDDAREIGPGQMRKSEFLDELRVAVCAIADAELAAVGRNTEGCPYIEQWIGHYRAQSGHYVERAIRRYAPETARATAARDYIHLIAERVRRAVVVWASTGEIMAVPEAVSSASTGTGATAESKNNAAMPGVQLKGRDNSVGGTKDPAAIQSELGSGHALDSVVKSRMESAFGYDFSSVRIHTDSKAAGLSSGLSARAFTIGSDVAFASGEYRPGTLTGDALIAHELAHVAQQGGATTTPMRKGGSDYDGLEEDADRSAVGAVLSLWGRVKGGITDISSKAMPRLKGGLGLQRCKDQPVPQSRISIIPSDVTPKIRSHCGEFFWFTNWTTSGRNGYIVQEIINTYSATDCMGAADTTVTPTPHFYEAWKVDARGNTTPEFVVPQGRVNDKWSRPEHKDSHGEWSITGKAYWTKILDPAANFAVGAVFDAHDLLSTTTRPTNLGVSLHDRRVGGRWDCCNGADEHEPT